MEDYKEIIVNQKYTIALNNILNTFSLQCPKGGTTSLMHCQGSPDNNRNGYGVGCSCFSKLVVRVNTLFVCCTHKTLKDKIEEKILERLGDHFKYIPPYWEIEKLIDEIIDIVGEDK